MKHTLTIITTVLLASLAVSRADDIAGTRPNVIFFITDDQGYGDISAHGNPILKTPQSAHFFGMIHNIDANIGKMLAKLDEWGIEKNTADGEKRHGNRSNPTITRTTLPLMKPTVRIISCHLHRRRFTRPASDDYSVTYYPDGKPAVRTPPSASPDEAAARRKQRKQRRDRQNSK